MTIDLELKSLISLLNDSDPVVQQAVIDRLVERGEKSIEIVEFELHKQGVEKEKSTNYLVEQIKRAFAFKRLSTLFEAPQPILDESLFWITKVVDPTTDLTLFLGTLQGLVEEIAEELKDNATVVERVTIFNFIFFKRFKFRYIDITMERSDSALIDRVLLSRAGNPVIITIIYLLLAQQSGLSIYPLCFLGGFVPVVLDSKGSILFYLNIFREGHIFGEETLRQFFKELQLTYSPESFSLEQERALITIYAEILHLIYQKAGDREKRKSLKEIITMLGGRSYF